MGSHRWDSDCWVKESPVCTLLRETDKKTRLKAYESSRSFLREKKWGQARRQLFSCWRYPRCWLPLKALNLNLPFLKEVKHGPSSLSFLLPPQISSHQTLPILGCRLRLRMVLECLIFLQKLLLQKRASRVLNLHTHYCPDQYLSSPFQFVHSTLRFPSCSRLWRQESVGSWPTIGQCCYVHSLTTVAYPWLSARFYRFPPDSHQGALVSFLQLLFAPFSAH